MGDDRTENADVNTFVNRKNRIANLERERERKNVMFLVGYTSRINYCSRMFVMFCMYSCIAFTSMSY